MGENSKLLNAEELIEAFQSGALTDLIIDRFGHVADDVSRDITRVCIELHNDGKIDLLSLASTPAFQAASGSRFFVGQHFFCKVIPTLKASLADMMRFVDALIQKGGHDLAANQPNAAFREWCEADLARAADVVETAEQDDPLARKFVTFALNAGNMIEKAMGFVEEYTDSRRLCAVTALGRMTYRDPSSASEVLRTLRRALDSDADGPLLANVLTSALQLAAQCNLMACEHVVAIVKRVSKSPSPQTLYCCAHALGQHHKSLSNELVSLLLHALKSVDSAHEGTIRDLDYGLGRLLETSHGDSAVEFVGSLLTSSKDVFALSQFKSFGRKLTEGPQERFQRAFVSWMLSGQQALCEGLSGLLGHADGGGIPIDLRIQDFSLSPLQQIFLCRKAIGYFFLQPVTAGSIIVSVLRGCDDEIAETARGLLFEPLLSNYGGALRDYLRGVDVEDPAYPSVQTAIERAEQYWNDVQSTGRIKELHPSEHDRQIEHLRFQDEMRRVHKGAEKASIFLNLVKRSVLLHGRRSITYIEGSNNERRPVEMELKGHSLTFEMPRKQTVDPVGLDYMLRVFRAERMRS